MRGLGKLREMFAGPAGRETIRAFLLFALCIVALAGIAGVVAFRDLSRMVVARRVELGRDEAVRIAEAVAALGRDRSGIDFHRLRQSSAVLAAILRERMMERPFVLDVEIRDRFGGRFLRVSRDAEAPLAGIAPGAGRSAAVGEGERERIITVQLRQGVRPEGEVRVGISQDTAERELDDLRRSLRLKAAVAAAFGVGVLVLGLFYVLHLIRKNRVLEQSRLSAERRSYVGLLASGLAHEIRNPLNAMNLNVQMLEEELQGIPGADSREFADLVTSTKSEIKRLESLVNNFLAFARPAEPRFEPKDLNAVLTEVARFLQADFKQSAVTLDLDLEPLLPTVEIDVTQLKQALMNLLVNARQVLKSGGRVVLRSRAGAGGEAIVEVEDDGPGVPGDVREKIFEVFYSNRGGGTGLGLPIARQIVERHGGVLEVADAPERGTVFRIRLPRRHEASGGRGGASR